MASGFKRQAEDRRWCQEGGQLTTGAHREDVTRVEKELGEARRGARATRCRPPPPASHRGLEKREGVRGSDGLQSRGME